MRLIGAMGANKINVFHWHITDSQSFPLVLELEPELASKGSYGSGMEYSIEDVKRVVEFGLENGVRIIPEIDMPGHTGSWAQAYPEIVACANMFWWPEGVPWEERLATEPGTFPGHQNPLIPKTYEVVKNVFKEVATLFPDTFFHGGADDVVPGCWKADPTIQKLVSVGYRTIVSSTDYYYLDCGHGDFTGNNSAYDQPLGTEQEKGGSWCGPFKSWQLIYNYDITYGLNETEAKLVLGGEVTLWSEQANGNVLDSRIWPRASAVGEVLWSGNRDETGKKRSCDTTDRLNEWIHRMVSRGVKAEPIQPLWCVRNHDCIVM
uniref:beta-N-acetylhexosaminidase n=1 Tax=Tanacetum cinerariifolium TaxID=118510 RepID=A0A6L2KAU8_TANCI|nr:beta-hexosaminidase 2 [Tanacetum cinerariifolium]